MIKRINLNLKPTQILVLGFLIMILLGTFLLNLPIASIDGKSIGLVNALFTSTSAVCVTGLSVVNTLEHWSLFGKIVIICLIQVGGLGFMTIATSLFILLGRKISLKERLIIQEALNQYTLSGMVRLTRNIFLGTLFLEGVGAIILTIRFLPENGANAIFMGIFHSISAFCNAGFDIIGDSSLTPYVGDVIVNITIIILIILSGLGFTVWLDLIKVTKEKHKEKYSLRYWFIKLTLHTKIVLVITTFLIVFGFIFYLVVESGNPNTLGNLSFKDKILGSLFQSVTVRTAGFNTVSFADMTDSSKLLTIILMFIGGSPGGTAGGVKTVTFGLILLAVITVIRAKEDVELFNRRISWSIVRRALAIMVISIGIVITMTMILSLTEPFDFMDILFETVSAFATVGLSLGITGGLTTVGKLLICLIMFIGRLGPLTMGVAFFMRSKKSDIGSIRLPEEKIMVG